MGLVAVLAGLLAASALVTLGFSPGARPGFWGLTPCLVVAAALTWLYAVNYGPGVAAMAFAVAAGAGAAASAVDLRHHLLPDLGTGLIALSGLVAAFTEASVLASMAAGLICVLILVLASFATRRAGRPSPMGEGDVYLAGACGVWLVPAIVPYALISAVMITLAIGLGSGQLRRNIRGKMAFGPGLAAGTGIMAAQVWDGRVQWVL